MWLCPGLSVYFFLCWCFGCGAPYWSVVSMVAEITWGWPHVEAETCCDVIERTLINAFVNCCERGFYLVVWIIFLSLRNATYLTRQYLKFHDTELIGPYCRWIRYEIYKQHNININIKIKCTTLSPVKHFINGEIPLENWICQTPHAKWQKTAPVKENQQRKTKVFEGKHPGVTYLSQIQYVLPWMKQGSSPLGVASCCASI
jgi:hypothetical protein